MRKPTANTALRIASGFVSTIAFVANLVSVGLFVRDVLTSREFPEMGTIVANVVLIGVVFFFALLLLGYSRDRFHRLDHIANAFGWSYVLLSAAIFALISPQFILARDYAAGDLGAYAALIAVIAALGYLTTKVVERRTDLFCIPFMLVALEHVLLWLYLVGSGRGIVLGWHFWGGLGLFIYAGILVLWFISTYEN